MYILPILQVEACCNKTYERDFLRACHISGHATFRCLFFGQLQTNILKSCGWNYHEKVMNINHWHSYRLEVPCKDFWLYLDSAPTSQPLPSNPGWQSAISLCLLFMATASLNFPRKAFPIPVMRLQYQKNDHGRTETNDFPKVPTIPVIVKRVMTSRRTHFTDARCERVGMGPTCLYFLTTCTTNSI